jgi:ATP-dependent DNA helicase RecG
LLLFNDNPEKFFPGSRIDVVIYHDEVGDQMTEKIFSGPIQQQLKNSLNYLKNNIIEERVIKVTGQAESERFFNYPFNALEEAMANAVYHRSYENRQPIEVNIREEKIEIISYPGPLPPVDNTVLQSERIIARNYRNRKIGDFLKELRLTEGRGTGIAKIRRSMSRNGSPDPYFETDSARTYFLVHFYIHPSFKRLLSRPSNYDLTLEDIRSFILNYCKQPRSKKEIFDQMDIPNNWRSTEKFIHPLLEAGFLEYTIPEKPKSAKQKYITTLKGTSHLDEASDF